MRNSRVLWPNRSKICGKNAASVSAFKSAGTWLATFKPSCSATSAPATPDNSMARATTSFGIARRLVKSVGGVRGRLYSSSSTFGVSLLSPQM